MRWGLPSGKVVFVGLRPRTPLKTQATETPMANKTAAGPVDNTTGDLVVELTADQPSVEAFYNATTLRGDDADRGEAEALDVAVAIANWASSMAGIVTEVRLVAHDGPGDPVFLGLTHNGVDLSITISPTE